MRVSAGIALLLGLGQLAQGQVIIDHQCMDITQIPQAAIEQAKANLHIAYGHTSHGSQLTTGMDGLVTFMNGLGHPTDLYAYNNGGAGGALDLRDYYGDFPGGAGDLGDAVWATATADYLDDPANWEVNVIIWAWCGQANTTEENINLYLSQMSALEASYPDVRFVYMTDHTDGTGLEGNMHVRNQQIRGYCIAYGKILYDFEDIESYNLDGTYFGDQYCDDYCAYTGGNWANQWANAHVEDVEWYDCLSAHSRPVNANQKAYAAWWLWARLGGWAGPGVPDTTKPQVSNASAQNSTTVRVVYNEAMTDDADLVDPQFYTFTGTVPLTASTVTRLNATTVDVTVNEMTNGAAYTVAVATASPTDQAGNHVDPAANTASFTGAGLPPNPPTVTGPALTNDTTPTWTWSSGGGGNGTYRYQLDSGGWSAETTAASYTPSTALTDGSHTLEVQERDGAMNWSASGTRTTTVDTVPPNPSVVTGLTVTNDDTPTWTWSTGGGGSGTYRYELDGGGWSVETAATSYTPSTALTDGPHTLEVQERDDAMNWSASGSWTVTVDTTLSDPPVVTGPAFTNDATPTWTWSSGGGTGTYRYELDGGGWSAATTATSYTPPTPLPEGPHTLEVQERDDAMNWSSSGAFTIEVIVASQPTILVPLFSNAKSGLSDSHDHSTGATR